MYYCFLRINRIRFRAFKSRDSVGPSCSVFKCLNNLINCYLQESHMRSSWVGVPRCMLELESPLLEPINPIDGLIWSKDGGQRQRPMELSTPFLNYYVFFRTRYPYSSDVTTSRTLFCYTFVAARVMLNSVGCALPATGHS